MAEDFWRPRRFGEESALSPLRMIEAQIAPQERTRPAKEFQKPRLLPGSARIQTGKPRAEERVTGQTLGAYVRAGLVWSRKSEAPVWVAIWVCGAIVLVVSFVRALF